MNDAPGLTLIALAARLVPRNRRQGWRQEWSAEAAYAWVVAQRTGRTSMVTRTRLRVRVVTCFFDALLERKETISMSGFLNDLRLAARSLIKRPGFTAISILTVALGIGATTAVFTLVDGVLLRPLPFEEPDELLSLQHLGRDGQDELPISSGLYLHYRDHARTLESVGVYTPMSANLVAEGQPERVVGQMVTPSYFDVLGVQAAVGRTFTEDEGAVDAGPVIILSDGLWRTRFGADPGLVGRTVELSGTSRTVVGIMPAEFGHPDADDRFWVPLAIDPTNAPIASFFGGGIARMAEGQSIEAVDRELQGMMGRLTELFPGDGGAAFLMDVGLRARVIPLKQSLVGDVSNTLWILLGTVGFVLLIACANVANLLLVRAESRQRELALRMAVGAGRMQVLRAFMAESVVLAGVGAALGIVIASAGVRTTARFLPSDLPRMHEIGIDPRVLGFTAVVAALCALFFGLFPMIRHGTDNLASQLRDGGGARGAAGGKEHHRLRNTLVVTQVALALVLLVGSGLMFRSFLALRAVDAGFDREGVLTAEVIVPSAEVSDWRDVAALFAQLHDRLSSQPGVTAVGLGSTVPLGGGQAFGSVDVEAHPRGPDELPIFAAQFQAGPGYFETLGIDVLVGREFERGDGADGARAVLVSRSFANQWWPDSSPLGSGIRSGGPDNDWYRIVGVVDDVKQLNLEDPVQGAVYYPLITGQGEELSAARALDVVVRTNGEPLSMVDVLRRELTALNPRIPLANPRTMEAVFDQATARTSFTMGVLGTASAIALLLGVVGIYGVISYVVSQRTREIGVRMALGASGSTVRRMVVRQGLFLAFGGVVVGLLAAAALSRLMASVLFGVDTLDPVTYASVAALLVAVAVTASWLPALRAAGVDPSTALRAE